MVKDEEVAKHFPDLEDDETLEANFFYDGEYLHFH